MSPLAIFIADTPSSSPLLAASAADVQARLEQAGHQPRRVANVSDAFSVLPFAEVVLVVAGDVPTFPLAAIQRAIDALTRVSVVFAPALSGEAWLAGFRHHATRPDLLHGPVGERVTRAVAEGLTVEILPDFAPDLRASGGIDVIRIGLPQASPPPLALREALKPTYAQGYPEALARLYALSRHGEKLDLTTPQALANALGNPERAMRGVIIGGTNGKGSTCAYLEALLRHRGVKTGLFTSPHLVSFRERIRIDGQDLPEAALSPLVDEVFTAAERAGVTPSFFEAAFAAASLAFARAGVELAIWEVGLGGRLDATNIVSPAVSGVASIGFDHMHILGDTLPAIAAEKAGIFRPDRPALTSATGDGLAALLSVSPAHLQVVPPLNATRPLPLGGAHQRQNASLAWAMCEALGVRPSEDAFSQVRWPGRTERFPTPDGDLILDCAHNPDGARALAAWLDETHTAPLHLIFGAMADKDVSGVVEALAWRAVSIDVVTPSYPRRMEAEVLAPKLAPWRARVAGTVGEALAARPKGVTTLVTGSCFLVGEARAWLLGRPFPECGLLTLAR